jgi:UvrD-like helicase family protein
MPEFGIDDLNSEQLRAATAGEGPVLTIAGAGTGKTKTLAARVAWLVSRGIDPGRIMLLTFTRRASDEGYAGLGKPWVSSEAVRSEPSGAAPFTPLPIGCFAPRGSHRARPGFYCQRRQGSFSLKRGVSGLQRRLRRASGRRSIRRRANPEP